MGSVGFTCAGTIPPPKDMVTDASALEGAVAAATEEIETARLKEMRLDYFGAKGRASVRQLILIGKPDRVRIQTYIPGLDGVAGVLACACGQFAYHDRQQDVYYYGPATARNVARVLPVGLTCRDLGSILLGGLPTERLERETSGEAQLVWDENSGRYRMTWALERGPTSGGRLTAQVRHEDWRVAELKVEDGSGEVQYTYTGRAFEKIKGFHLPTSRRFLIANESEDVSMSGGTIQINPELSDMLFQLEPPAGTTLSFVGDTTPPPPPPQGGDLCSN